MLRKPKSSGHDIHIWSHGALQLDLTLCIVGILNQNGSGRGPSWRGKVKVAVELNKQKIK